MSLARESHMAGTRESISKIATTTNGNEIGKKIQENSGYCPTQLIQKKSRK